MENNQGDNGRFLNKIGNKLAEEGEDGQANMSANKALEGLGQVGKK
jgi:hypothetical protein